MSLHSIVIDADDGDTAKGPRGLHLGMSAESALNLFQCDNPDAIKYLHTGDENLLTQNGELQEISLYEPYEDEDSTQAYEGSVYLGNGSHYEDGVLIKERRTVLSYDIIDWATLYVEITDGTVSQIDVCYWS